MIEGLYYNGPTASCLSRKGSIIQTCRCLIIKIGDEYKLIDSKEKVIQYFIPIQNKQEAISYLSLVTESYPIYDFKFKKSILNKTYVDSISEGYIVHLFEQPACGCGHPYSEVTYKLDSAGDYTVLKKEEVFHDPKEDGICVD
jgi:hypothetical protein